MEKKRLTLYYFVRRSDVDLATITVEMGFDIKR